MTKREHRAVIAKAIAMLAEVHDDMHNRSPIAPRKRTAPPTRRVRSEILRLHRFGWSQQKIAHRLDISIGRVSETIRGKRR